MQAPAPMIHALHDRRLRRVLLLIPSSAHGGTERHAIALARTLVATGVTVSIAADPSLHAALARDAAGLRLVGARIAWDAEAPQGENIRRQSEALGAVLDTQQADAAILPLPWPNAGLGLMARLAVAGLPTLVIGHLAPPETPPGLDPSVAAGLQARWVAVSQPIATRLEAAFALAAGRVAVIPNGVPPSPPIDAGERRRRRAALRAELDLPPDATIALFAGRLDQVKGAELLPFLAQAFCRRGGGALVAAGGGPLAERLAAGQTGGRAVLRLLGNRGDIGRLLDAADALLLPSRLEGCPLIFLEAASHRCPVVATPAALEGFGAAAPALARLAPAEDIAALAAALVEACARGPETQARILAAAEHARRHDQAAMLDAYRAALRGLAPISAPISALA